MSQTSSKNKELGLSGTELETLFREHNEALLRLLMARPGLVDDAKEVAREA